MVQREASVGSFRIIKKCFGVAEELVFDDGGVGSYLIVTVIMINIVIINNDYNPMIKYSNLS
jgi:hypothetical protein